MPENLFNEKVFKAPKLDGIKATEITTYIVYSPIPPSCLIKVLEPIIAPQITKRPY
jgi:hypothetical protein